MDVMPISHYANCSHLKGDVTRARSKVVASARTDTPSSFLSELLRHDQVISNVRMVKKSTQADSQINATALAATAPNPAWAAAAPDEHDQRLTLSPVAQTLCRQAFGIV